MIEIYNIDAEQSVLGTLLRDFSKWARISELLTVDDFFRYDHQLIFRAMSVLAGQNKIADVVAVEDQLGAALEEVGGLGYLGKLSFNAVANQYHIEILKKKTLIRQGLSALATASTAIYSGENVHEAIAALTATVGQLSTESKTSTDWAEAIDVTMEAIDDAAEANANGGIVGAPTGIPLIDNRIQGIHGENLIVVAGRPSLGKTALVLQWALHATTRGHKVGICSLETSTAIIGARSLAHDAQANISDLVNGRQSAVSKIPDVLDKTLKRQLWINDLAYTLPGIVAQISAWRREHDIDYAIVDHIGLIETDKYSSKNDQVGEVTRTLKKLTKQIGIPIVAVCQLNRTVEKDKRRPKLSDLRDSGNVEQDADIVLMIHSTEGEQEYTPIELGFMKLRLGRKGWMDCFTFQGSTQTFREIEQQNGFVRAV